MTESERRVNDESRTTKAKNISQILITNVVVLLSIFFIIESGFRLVYPEFIGHIHSTEISLGQHTITTDNLAGVKASSRGIRVPYQGYELNDKDALILLLGDSITVGYGSSYEDIYWNVFQRMINNSKVDSIQIVPLSGYGNNLRDSKEALSDAAANSDREIRMIIYQFNFNDINPYNQKALKNRDYGADNSTLFQKFAEFRYEHLNKSVALRVISHYVGALRRNRDGTCEERAIDALGPYTWTFGSSAFMAQSEALWNQFEIDLTSIKEFTDSLGTKFTVLISPILYDIDKNSHHPYYNYLNYDFDCATIEPKERLRFITERLGVDIVDPADFVKERFEYRLREGNFTPFFFTADDNHFTPVTSTYIAEYFFTYYLNSSHIH